MKKVRALVFPCGSENASEISLALRNSLHVELYGASSVDDHGRFGFKNYRGNLPKIVEPEFDAAFRKLIAELGVEVVFATHDSVVEYLANSAQELGLHLVNGAPLTARIARRKSLTYRSFPERAWIPQLFASAREVNQWPVVVKPDLGQGGQGVHVARDLLELNSALKRIEEPILVEYLPGEEITVDCFTDRMRRMVWIGPRTRERVRAGISMRSRHLGLSAEIAQIAEEINAVLELRGPWFFQLKKDKEGRWKLLEISCRIAGTMVAQRAKGINLPLMAIHDYLGRDLVALPEARITMVDRRIATFAELEYEFDHVYIDLDDTLVSAGLAIPQMMRFIYRMLELRKRIVLVTRHAGDLDGTLAQARISKALFDEIIHITDDTPKSAFIRGRAIFIDNHFPERLDVSNRHGIPVFDVDMAELLAL